MACTINKRSTGFSPLLGIRDWLIVAGMFVIIVAAVYWTDRWMPGSAWRFVVVGCLGAMVPSLNKTLPVHGTVAVSGSTALLGRIEQMGFVPAGHCQQGCIFKPKRQRWLDLDSNRIVIGAADGDLIPVTVPMHFYRSLKRRQL